jgi:hypothetical protein
MQVSVGAMVDREVEPELGLPTVPEALQNAVSLVRSWYPVSIAVT